MAEKAASLWKREPGDFLPLLVKEAAMTKRRYRGGKDCFKGEQLGQKEHTARNCTGANPRGVNLCLRPGLDPNEPLGPGGK